MKFRHTPLLLALMLFAPFPTPAHAAATAPEIGFHASGESVHATGLTPGGPVAVICAWRTTTGDFSQSSTSWRDGLATEGGVFDATFVSQIPAGAFIAVIDGASGRVALTTGDTTTFQQVDLPAKRLRRGPNREVEALTYPNEAVLLVVARRGEGIWVRAAHDGGAGDADDAVDGKITTDPATLQPLAGSPSAPKKIRPHDFILVVDTSSRLFASTEVEP